MNKLYVNENFPMPVVNFLRLLGHDVLTSLEAGNANQWIPDDAVLNFATTENRILVTLNRRDFIKLHKINSSHAGIIVCTEDADCQALAMRIHLSLFNQTDNFANQLIRVYKP
jgi:predicted nuclease of predicted toxin-antitoxin system